MNKIIGGGLMLLILLTLLLEPQVDYKLKHSQVPLLLSFVLFFPNKITRKLGLFVCCWGIINLVLRDQYAAEPTIFHIGYWMTNYSLNLPNTFFDLILFWWFPIYIYVGVIFLMTRKKVKERYFSHSSS